MEESDIKGGMRLQRIADEVIFAALKYGFPSILHNMMNWRGLDSGYSRRPFYNYQDSELEGLKEDSAASFKSRSISISPASWIL